MPSIKYSFEAVCDLQRLKEFLATKSPTAADRAKKAILSSLKILAQQPLAGKAMRDMPEQFREWNIRFGKTGYVACYRVVEDGVIILAIRHNKEAGYSWEASFVEECRRQSLVLQEDRQEKAILDWIESVADLEGYKKIDKED